MVRGLLVGAGLLVSVAGVIFTLQGVGLIGGSVMTGSTFWAVAGPVVQRLTYPLGRESSHQEPSD